MCSGCILMLMAYLLAILETMVRRYMGKHRYTVMSIDSYFCMEYTNIPSAFFGLNSPKIVTFSRFYFRYVLVFVQCN